MDVAMTLYLCACVFRSGHPEIFSFKATTVKPV